MPRCATQLPFPGLTMMQRMYATSRGEGGGGGGGGGSSHSHHLTVVHHKSVVHFGGSIYYC